MIFYLDLLLMVQLIFLRRCGQGQDVEGRVAQVAKQIENAFNNVRNFLNQSYLVQNFSAIQPKGVNGLDILNSSKIESEKLVTKIQDTVNNLQSNLTNSFLQYKKLPSNYFTLNCSDSHWIPYYISTNLRINSFPIPRNCTNQSLPLTKDAYLGNVFTNRDTSTAHIPTNVYDFSIAIQTAANWTDRLDRVFRLKNNDSQIKWQYFCSQTGLFKIFPGIQWKLQRIASYINRSIIDPFDCRFEQFYLESTAYPKRALIMVDGSGSMTGRSFIIANKTAQDILSTLTENDFFNILMYKSTCNFVNNQTYGTLVQATELNKQATIMGLRNSSGINGTADFISCVNLGLNLFKMDKSQQDPNIPFTYFIAVVTDASFDFDPNQIKNEVQARIFTFTTVQGTQESSDMKKIACPNNGFAYDVSSMSSIKENLQNQLEVFARKNAIMQNAFNIWTGVNELKILPSEEQKVVNTTLVVSENSSAPLSTFFTSRFKPIQLIISSAKAVYDQTPETAKSNKGVLLGSTGVKLSPEEFRKTAPFWKIGVNAYLFGITSSGFLLFHPKYRPQFEDYLKPTYRNVDISFVEVQSSANVTSILSDPTLISDNTTALRNSMLNQSLIYPPMMAMTLTTHQIIDEFKTGFSISRDYFITSIANTPYRFGLAIPVEQVVPLYTNEFFRIIDVAAFSKDLNSDYNTALSQCNTIHAQQGRGGMTMKTYEFCDMNLNLARLQLQGPLCTLINVFTNTTLLELCVADRNDSLLYLNNVYLEIRNTSHFPNHWESLDGLGSNIQQIFSMHHFGLIRYFNYDNISYENFILNHIYGIDDPLYQETILISQYFKNDQILVANPLPHRVYASTINAKSMVFSITMPLVSQGVYIGIVGVQTRFDYFYIILNGNLLCGDTALVECYILTESSVIFLNNQNISNNGMLLMDFNCALMESLIDSNIFLLQYFYDFQGLCEETMRSFSTRAINPFSCIFNGICWLIFKLFTIITNLSLASFRWLLTSQEENYPYNVRDSSKARTCYLKIPRTLVKPLTDQINGSIVCTACTKTWFVRPINNTNLLLVILQKSDASCSCQCKRDFGNVTELTRDDKVPISNPFVANPNYYSSFVPFTKTEDSTECRQCRLSPHILLLVLSLCSALKYRFAGDDV